MAVPALIEWIDILGQEEVTEGSDVDRTFESAQQKLDPRFLIPGLSKLTRQAMLHTLIDAITPYLDNQQTWLDLAQCSLHTLLVHVGTSMSVADVQATGSGPEYGEPRSHPVLSVVECCK